MSMIRTRWAAVGAAVAVTLGAGGIGLVEADQDTGDRPVTVTIEPCRISDTRPTKGIGPRTTPLGAAEAYPIQGTGPSGNCNIPTDATGLVLNVTADQATMATNLRLYPTGGTVPTASNLNPRPGAPPTPNAVTVGLNNDGEFTVRNAKGTVHIIIDVTAYLIDHHHDDRYVRAREGYVRLTPYEMRPVQQGSNWTIDFGWKHAPPTLECIHGRAGLPVGEDVTAMNLVYHSSGDANLTVSLSAQKATSGSTVTGIPPLAVFNGTASATGPTAFADLAIPVASPMTVLEDYNYVVSVCSADAIEIIGADITVD